MFIFDGLSGVSRTVALRHRQANCAVCGEKPSISSLIDYELFCGSGGPDDKCRGVSLLEDKDRVSCQEYHSVVKSGVRHHLIDVRPRTEFAICHLDNAISILQFWCICAAIRGVAIRGVAMRGMFQLRKASVLFHKTL